MANPKIQELTLDLAELNQMFEQLKRPRNIDAILLQKKRIETELSNLRAQSQANPETQKVRTVNSEVKRYECDISNYAWDQSDKFVKFFIALDGVQDASEENVVVTFKPQSILLKVANVQNKDHKFEVNNLLQEIDVEKSYRKIKTNSVAIYAKKAVEGKKWSHLTSTEKKLADMKKSDMENDLASDKDPNAGLMNIMKKMYDSGDSETKRMIAKAWTEGQEKSRNPELQF
ncbi:calcyclin-binding protein [Contarinia nasturtii]|uniref:calcyclin-binding protein n=1 Tax=Contarinia nasturtii TaxID=265458 RepID=UPI0012D46B58|nr:calcyclin-binding protein [Contarinia nasturtii]